MTDHHPDAGEMVSLTFAETYPGGRILLMLGRHQVGAVFPPCGEPGVWRSLFWLNSPFTAREKHSRTELAAKNAILAEARDWLRKAGLA